MKLFIYSKIQSIAELCIAILDHVYRPFNAIRVWAWEKATLANMERLNRKLRSWQD